MSSILDALKKLEAEKANAGRAPARLWPKKSVVPPVPDRREPERPAPSPAHNRITIHITPMSVVLGAIVVGMLPLTAFLGASVLVARSNAEWMQFVRTVTKDATLPVAPASELPGPPPGSRSALAQAGAPAKPPGPKTPAPKADPKPAQLERTSNLIQSTPLPNLDLMASAAPAAASPPRRPDNKPAAALPGPTPKKLEGPIDLYSLPFLKETDKERLGLAKLQVNMVSPATKNKPQPSAIINLQPVNIGDRIADTKATLIAVDRTAIAIEVDGTGERFQIRY
jgi:hypothetical protein